MNDWIQTPKTITIYISIPYKISADKVDHMITENFIKVNIPDQRVIKLIDLHDSINIESSNIVIEEKRISIYLDKLIEGSWPSLEYKTTNKEELKARRKIGEENYQKRLEGQRNLAVTKKKELERFVIDKSMQIDDEKRKELKDKKTNVKQEAENELYDFVNKVDKANNEKPLEEKKKIITQREEIFNKDEISVRSQTQIKVNLTEKLVPHFAARESMTKEPPYPKSKKYVPEKNMVKHNNFIFSWDKK